MIGAHVVPYQPVHCNIQHLQRRKQHILGLSDKCKGSSICLTLHWPVATGLFSFSTSMCSRRFALWWKITLKLKWVFFSSYYFHSSLLMALPCGNNSLTFIKDFNGRSIDLWRVHYQNMTSARKNYYYLWWLKTHFANNK